MARSQAKTQTAHQHAIAYVRVSTAGQVEDGVSLDAQRAKIAAWCEVMGYELVQTCADAGISGHSIEKRPGLQQAVDAVCACRGVLVVYSLSRLARNTRETLELGERLSKAGADLLRSERHYGHGRLEELRYYNNTPLWDTRRFLETLPYYVIIILLKRERTMPRKPIDLEAVRRADAKLARLLAGHPELRDPNPERQQALEDWLQDHTQEDTDDATTEDRETIRPTSDLQ